MRERTLFANAGTPEGQPPIYAGAYNNAHIERKNNVIKTNNVKVLLYVK